MRVKDLLKELEGIDPETVINGLMYIEELPDYYDGPCSEVMDCGKIILTRDASKGGKLKINLHTFSIDDLMLDCACEDMTFEQAWAKVDCSQLDSGYEKRYKEYAEGRFIEHKKTWDRVSSKGKSDIITKQE